MRAEVTKSTGDNTHFSVGFGEVVSAHPTQVQDVRTLNSVNVGS